IQVKATREGLVGQKTASGYIIDTVVPYVTLPARALHRFVRVSHGGNFCIAIVLDVGPWNVDDNAYVFQPATQFNESDLSLPERRPQAESGTDKSGRRTNGAG